MTGTMSALILLWGPDLGDHLPIHIQIHFWWKRGREKGKKEKEMKSTANGFSCGNDHCSNKN